MLIKTLTVGNVETNCYIVTDENENKTVIIDPGDESNYIMDYVEDNRLNVEAIFITHGHYDHVGAAEAVAEETGAPVYINKKDCLDKPNGYFPFVLPENGHYYSDGDVIAIGSLEFRIIETPGHTPGGVVIVCQDAIFSGDTLFKGTCGRCDLPGGDEMTILRSLKKVCGLEGNYEVYPGHMEYTSLEHERMFNYYCRTAMQI